MADEPTTTDTTTSTTEVLDTTTTEEVVTQPDTADQDGQTPAADADTSDDEGTVLGGNADDEDGADDGAPQGAPENYELSLKDDDGNDIPLNEEVLGEATELFREMNLTNEQAQTLLPLGQKMLNTGIEQATKQIIEAGAAQKKAWLDEFEASDLGGSNRKETETHAAKALDALGFTEGHEFRKLLTETGFGNNVHFISAFAKVGQLVGEDGTFAKPNADANKEVAGWTSRYKQD